MTPVWQRSGPHTLIFRTRPGWYVMAFGVLFIAIALYLLTQYPLFPPLEPPRDSRAMTDLCGALPVAALFASVGLLCAFGRFGFVIDARTRTIRKWWGLGRPLWHRTHALTGFNHVRIGWKPPRYSFVGEQSMFLVSLGGLGTGRGQVLRLVACADEQAARRLAAAIARLLDLVLCDDTGCPR